MADALAREPSPMPETVAPMLARTGELPADDRAFGYEVKWDGVRAVARADGGRVALTGRSGADFTRRYPEVTAIEGALRSRRLIVDGELVALDAGGRPSFERLQGRMHLEGPPAVARRALDTPVTYIVFDLLWLGGSCTLGLPYSERRRLLEALELGGGAWRVPAYHEADGESLLGATREQGLEGVIAKRLDSPYEPGRRSSAWIKVKNRAAQDVVIGGYTDGKGGRARTLGALCVGVFSQGRLTYAGKVGAGFTERSLAALLPRLRAGKVEASPFEGRQPPRGTRFVAPRLVARVEFAEWTRAGTLRAPVYKGLREDIDVSGVVREA